MGNETEQRWYSGQKEYTVEEIEHMLESQRAMIHNDLKHILRRSYVDLRVKIEILDYLRNPRKVKL